MAVWGKFGGKFQKKASLHPTDFPEGCEILLELGANSNSVDEYGVSPLATACSSGGDRCIDQLVAAGADLNHQNKDGVTALHECFYRGNIDCLKQLLKYKDKLDTSIKTFRGELPIDALFIDDQSEILEFITKDEDAKKLIKDDQNLTINKNNIERLMSKAIIYMAKDCYEILLKHLTESETGKDLDHSTLLARTLTIYNFSSQNKLKDPRINLDMLSQLDHISSRQFGFTQEEG